MEIYLFKRPDPIRARVDKICEQYLEVFRSGIRRTRYGFPSNRLFHEAHTVLWKHVDRQNLELALIERIESSLELQEAIFSPDVVNEVPDTIKEAVRRMQLVNPKLFFDRLMNWLNVVDDEKLEQFSTMIEQAKGLERSRQSIRLLVAKYPELSELLGITDSRSQRQA